MQLTLRVPSGVICAVALGLLAKPAAADSILTVDLSTTIGPVNHCASGSLYGVTEKFPADITRLVAPLHPNVFVNPVSEAQHPGADAIVVAARLAPVGARVTIRLADWFTGFYTFTTMADWFDKVSQTVSRKQSSGLTNFYGYEIWNEPDYTWASTNPLPFNEFWMQTAAYLRQLDPGCKIIGPSVSHYDNGYMTDFLSYCQSNNCLPDIVGWHQLSVSNLTGDLQAYRALEKQLGIGPLPISINEYSGNGQLLVEGMPGASAPLIAKFERFGVDSACISYWDSAHPGRLGSLLLTNSDDTNGGWWFYKWYGDMTGSMVSTTPPKPNTSFAFDGFANLDPSAGSASVLFGGVNDGTIQVVVTGFHAAPFFGNYVHAVVEHTPFVNRNTVVTATDTLSSADLVVTDDEIEVSVPSANPNDGYRLILTPATGSIPDAAFASDAGTSSGGAAASDATASTKSSRNQLAGGGCSCKMAGLSGRGDALELFSLFLVISARTKFGRKRSCRSRLPTIPCRHDIRKRNL